MKYIIEWTTSDQEPNQPPYGATTTTKVTVIGSVATLLLDDTVTGITIHLTEE